MWGLFLSTFLLLFQPFALRIHSLEYSGQLWDFPVTFGYFPTALVSGFQKQDQHTLHLNLPGVHPLSHYRMLFWITSCFRTSGLEHQLTNHLPVTSHHAPPQAFEGHPWWPGQSALRWAGVTPCSLWLCQGVGEPLGLGERRERRPADGEQWLQSLPAVLGTRSQRLLLPSPSAKYVTQIQHCKPLPENLHDTVSRSICLTGCGVLI